MKDLVALAKMTAHHSIGFKLRGIASFGLSEVETRGNYIREDIKTIASALRDIQEIAETKGYGDVKDVLEREYKSAFGD